MTVAYEICGACNQEIEFVTKWEFPFTEPGKGAGKHESIAVGKARSCEREEILGIITELEADSIVVGRSLGAFVSELVFRIQSRK